MACMVACVGLGSSCCLQHLPATPAGHFPSFPTHPPPLVQVAELGQQLATRDQHLDEQTLLLRKVAEAKQLQTAVVDVLKQLHMEQLGRAHKLLEQVRLVLGGHL